MTEQEKEEYAQLAPMPKPTRPANIHDAIARARERGDKWIVFDGLQVEIGDDSRPEWGGKGAQ